MHLCSEAICMCMKFHDMQLCDGIEFHACLMVGIVQE
jgi:hypothetical protein